MEKETLGSYLRKIRMQHGLSLRGVEALSRQLTEFDEGLTYSHIDKIEKGHASPTIRTLQKLAATLGISLVLIFDEHSSKPDTVTVFSAPEISEDLLQALHRPDVIQLLLACKYLTEQQVNSLVEQVRDMKVTLPQVDEGSTSSSE